MIRFWPDDSVISEKIRVGSVPALVLRPKTPVENAPGVLWIHGGGYMLGMKEMVYMSRAVDLVREFGAVVVSPGYTLALIRPYPAAAEDCYTVLRYMDLHAAEFGFARGRLLVGGESAGGGLAAAVCMMARDRGDVKIAFQLPLYPMLSNLDTVSSYKNHGKIWNTRRNHVGWRLYLRADAHKNVSPYASPARQTDYAGLPPCYTFVGDGEPFYAETLQYVKNLRQAGVPAVADVYPTDVHGFDMLFPKREVSRQATAKFLEQVARALETFVPARG